MLVQALGVGQRAAREQQGQRVGLAAQHRREFARAARGEVQLGVAVGEARQQIVVPRLGVAGPGPVPHRVATGIARERALGGGESRGAQDLVARFRGQRVGSRHRVLPEGPPRFGREARGAFGRRGLLHRHTLECFAHE